MPAPKGNKNRLLAENQRRRGKNMNISMGYEEWEAFKAACDLVAGRCLDDDDVYIEQWRAVDRAARTAFIKQNHGLTDPAIIM